MEGGRKLWWKNFSFYVTKKHVALHNDYWWTNLLQNFNLLEVLISSNILFCLFCAYWTHDTASYSKFILLCVIIVEVPDYESLFDVLSSKKDSVGLINTDVAWYYQDTLRERPEPLRIIKQLLQPQPVRILRPTNMENSTARIFDYCFSKEMRTYTLDFPSFTHRGYIKVNK